MDEKNKKFLLELARKTIKGEDLKNIKPESDELKKKQGIFVTLTEDGELRGCIGHIVSMYPIYEGIMHCAKSAAFEDPRFQPVSKDEIDKLHIEISILTEPKKLEYKDGDDLLKKLNKEDGVILKKSFFSATFLPQVWEQLPKKEEFLGHLCMKAGLPTDEWKKGDVEIEIYHVEKFEE